MGIVLEIASEVANLKRKSMPLRRRWIQSIFPTSSDMRGTDESARTVMKSHID
jgi:hypothetical protein